MMMIVVTDLARRAMQDTAEFGVGSPVFVGIRLAIAVAVVTLLGVLALHFVVVPRVRKLGAARDALVSDTSRAGLRLANVALVTIGAFTVARLVAQHVAFFGFGGDFSRDSLSALLMHTSWGTGWWLAFASTAVGLWAVKAARSGRPHGWPLLAIAALVLTVSMALSGHPAGAHSPVIAIGLHAAHVVGAGGWVGALFALVVIAFPAALRSGELEGHELIADLVRSFSPAALFFASVVALTGVIAAWRNVGSLDSLWRSDYGQILMLKLAFLSATAGAGAYNWKRVLPTLGEAPASQRLKRSATVELVAGLAILAVTAVLVATPMPME